MGDGTLLLILLIPAALAFAFGLWAGMGYPGMYGKYERTGRAPRQSPLRWLLRGGRRPLRSELSEAEEDDEEPRQRTRPQFDRGRRFRR